MTARRANYNGKGSRTLVFPHAAPLTGPVLVSGRAQSGGAGSLDAKRRDCHKRPGWAAAGSSERRSDALSVTGGVFKPPLPVLDLACEPPDKFGSRNESYRTQK